MDLIDRLKAALARHRGRALKLQEEETTDDGPRLYGWKQGRASGILEMEEELSSMIRRWENTQ